MPMIMKEINTLAIILYFIGVGFCRADYHTNTITTPDGVYAFSVDGSPANNPTIVLQAGVTNILDIQTVDYHPVVITSSPNVFDWYDGADPQVVNAQPITMT